MNTVDIRPATTADTHALARLIAEAFAPLQACQWLVPHADPDIRVEVLSRHFAIPIAHALTYGHLDTTADRAAVAVWLPRGRDPLHGPVDYDRRLTEACGDHTPRFRALDDLFDRHHPTDVHHHLALLAVAPERQGRGLGSALLRYHHQALDSARAVEEARHGTR